MSQDEGSGGWPQLRNAITRVIAYVKLGRGVTGNTTFGLWPPALMAMVVAPFFVVFGYPAYAFATVVAAILWYIWYQGVTWYGVSKNPDASATSDDDYATVIGLRVGAKDPQIIDHMPPATAIPSGAGSVARAQDDDDVTG